MSTVDELIATSRLIELQPGDLLVLELPGAINAEQAATVKETLRSYSALADHEIVVLGGGARLNAVRAAE